MPTPNKKNPAIYHCRERVVERGLDGDAVAVDDDDPGDVLDVGDPPQDLVQVGGDGDVAAGPVPPGAPRPAGVAAGATAPAAPAAVVGGHHRRVHFLLSRGIGRIIKNLFALAPFETLLRRRARGNKAGVR